MDSDLLRILRCPACRGELAAPANEEMACLSCGLVYPVRNEVPVLLVDEARRRDGPDEG